MINLKKMEEEVMESRTHVSLIFILVLENPHEAPRI